MSKQTIHTDVVIFLKSGKGGRGSVSFLREKYKARGNADGGDGGKGGDVVFYASAKIHSLQSYVYGRHLTAESGSPGSSKKKSGKRGANLRLAVPLHTRILSTDNTLLAQLDEDAQEYVMLQGGRGGKGNAFFSSSRLRSPRFSQEGEPGVSLRVRLQTTLKADALIFCPLNTVDSLLIAQLTNAKDFANADVASTQQEYTIDGKTEQNIKKQTEAPIKASDVVGRSFLRYGTFETLFDNYTLIESSLDSYTHHALHSNLIVLRLDIISDTLNKSRTSLSPGELASYIESLKIPTMIAHVVSSTTLTGSATEAQVGIQSATPQKHPAKILVLMPSQQERRMPTTVEQTTVEKTTVEKTTIEKTSEIHDLFYTLEQYFDQVDSMNFDIHNKHHIAEVGAWLLKHLSSGV